MRRRLFLIRSAQFLALTKLGLLARQSPNNNIPPAIGELYRKAVVIDACAGVNSDSLDLPLKSEITKQALQSGVTAINWTVSLSSFEDTVALIAYINGLVEGDPAHWTIIRIHSDLDRAKREQKIGVMLGFQDPSCLGADLDRIELFRELGVRIIQLTYNNRALYGDGCLEPGNAGLSKLGRSAVAKMNALGVAVDLSHCGQRTTAEGIEASSKPVLITHAGCSAVHPHPRNKDDRELRALADHGGVIGIYFMPIL